MDTRNCGGRLSWKHISPAISSGDSQLDLSVSQATQRMSVLANGSWQTACQLSGCEGYQPDYKLHAFGLTQGLVLKRRARYTAIRDTMRKPMSTAASHLGPLRSVVELRAALMSVTSTHCPEAT